MKTHTIFHYSCMRYREKRLKLQLKSWPSRLPGNVESIPVIGSGLNNFNSGILRLKCPDDYKSLCLKTISIFKWFLNNCESDWIIKADDDVWVSDEGMQTLLKDTSPYSGGFLTVLEGIRAIAGPLYKIRRDLVEKILKDNLLDQSKYFEDIMVGAALNKLKITPKEIFKNKERLKWPCTLRNLETKFVYCNRSERSLQKMYESLDTEQDSLRKENE